MPDWRQIVRLRLAALRMEPAAEALLVEELAQHLEDRYGELCSGGSSPEEAGRAVLAELRDLHPLRAAVAAASRMPQSDPVRAGDITPGGFLEGLWRDTRYAFRSMRQSPAFVLFVVVTLALGIGANTTVFTVINTLILNPLPVSDPGGLSAVASADVGKASRTSTPFPISYADLQDYRAGNRVFRSLSGYTSPRTVSWQENRSVVRLFTELVTADYFDTLGLTPAKGRFFAPGEDDSTGTHAVAVINYGTWQTNFGGDADIVGKQLRLNNLVFTVVGVAPPKFIGVNAIFGPDLWIPAGMAERLLPGGMANALTDRGKAVFQAVGRRNPGVTEAQARANMTTLAAGLAREYPSTHQGHTVTVRPIRDMVLSSAELGPGTMLFAGAALLIVVGIVLLIACSNVANLLLARSAVRQREMAVRLAMGASRGRLVRQLLTESVLLGLFSGALGLGVGWVGLRLLFGSLPGAANFVSPKLDVTVFLFALALSLATGFIFGAFPALQASRANVSETLKEGARSLGRAPGRITIANALLVAQVAFSFLLLVTATLFLRSIGRAYQMDPGFQTAHLAIFMTNPGQAGYEEPRAREFYKEVRSHVARLPGVESVSWSSNLPLWALSASGLEIEGRPQRSSADTLRSIVSTVDRGFFRTAGVAIESGRGFTDADGENGMPVAVINAKLAHDYWPSGALGKRIRIPGETRMRQIVGVARTANYSTWGEAPQYCVYVPLAQHYQDAMTLYVRSRGDPGPLMTPVAREIRAAGSPVLANDMRTGREIISNGLFQARVGVALLSVFGLLALGLASIGLYGILAYSVNRRRRELGLRMALGAPRASVLGLILRQGMVLVLAGMGLGLAASLTVGGLLSRMLYGVSASDPVSIAVAALTLSLVALLACALPARWATRVDPQAALREG